MDAKRGSENTASQWLSKIEGATMRSAARFIATVSVAFLVAPLLYADGAATLEPKAKKDKSAHSIVAPAEPAKVQPNNAKTLPVRSPANRQSEVGTSAHPGRAARVRDEEESGYPRVEWFLGYSFWRAMPTALSNRMGYLHGGSTSLAYNFNRYLGLVADFGGYDNTRVTLISPTGRQTFDSSGSAYTYVFGPRLSYRKYERFTPFAHVLVGGTHANAVNISGCAGSSICTPLGSDDAFATMMGAGFDIKVSRHVALRLFQGDFLLTHYKNPLTAGGQFRGWQKNARFSSGIVFRFGGNPAPPPVEPIAATCSADKEMVYAGSGDFVAVHAETSNPGQYPLSYSWSASEGSVDGTGPQIRWSSSDRRPGTYMIQVHVDNGRSGPASCSVNVRVAQRPNRPPTMSCSASRTSVSVGEGAEITATASDPDDDPLSYSWNASGGKIEGSGSSVRFRTADLPPGPYTITGHVDDGRAGTADCTTSVNVNAPPIPAEVGELEARLSLHSIYFATARPTIANPAGGLVESQQQVLVSLAADFNRYLTFKPDAHLTLEGHADHRGSIEYNQHLTERRVERAQAFLIEHGVPAANIETKAFGEQDNLNADQVKQLVDENSDLSNEERQRLEANLHVIVLANNRRVDISLNSTGQQSVRRYPFNAHDSLTLLSTQGGEGQARAKSPAKKAKP